MAYGVCVYVALRTRFYGSMLLRCVNLRKKNNRKTIVFFFVLVWFGLAFGSVECSFGLDVPLSIFGIYACSE